MLLELKEEIINQPEKSVCRRIFVDDKDLMDLYVWYDNQNNIIGFQLCYETRSKAVTWKPGYKLLHENIKDGNRGGYRGNLQLVPDGILNREKLAIEFKNLSGNIDRNISELVYQKLLETVTY